MLVTVPSRNHPVYLEFKKWHKKIQQGPFDQNNYDARDSIERIATYLYGRDTGSIAGYMIIMIDTEDMEDEENQKIKDSFFSNMMEK